MNVSRQLSSLRAKGKLVRHLLASSDEIAIEK
jgi:hypothetical protein